MSGIIYLDYAATTPLDPDVARAMQEVMAHAGHYGNAASITHAPGRRAAARVEEARAQVAALIGAAPEEIVFTSGATESNNLAILGVARANADRGRHIITSRIEHKAVLDPCRQLEREGFAVTRLTPDTSGRISVEAVRDALRPETVLVSVMHVNNETGVVQDIRGIGELCRERGVTFHTDAAQAVGKLPVNVGELPVDLLAFTAHKLYGPQGIGALYVRPSARPRLRPILFGGGQERGLRPGTLPLHQIVGFGAACELAGRYLESEPARLAQLRDRLWAGIAAIGHVHLNGQAAARVPDILNVSFEGVEGESLVMRLGSLALTTGSACNSASGEPSYVLRALGRSSQLAQSSLRLSLGRGTTERHVDDAVAAIRSAVTRLREVSPASPDCLGGVATVSHGSATASICARMPADGGSSASPQTDVHGAAGASAKTGEGASGADLASSTSATGKPISSEARDVQDPLSAMARHYFDALPAAGAPAEAPGTRIVRGEAGSAADGTWVRFHLIPDDGVVRMALFQAYGCPHTLAVAAWLATQLPGRPRDDAVPGTPAAWMDRMQVPIEKLGRLLVVEDALRAALRNWE
jgi:cysteine desulfurase